MSVNVFLIFLTLWLVFNCWLANPFFTFVIFLLISIAVLPTSLSNFSNTLHLLLLHLHFLWKNMAHILSRVLIMSYVGFLEFPLNCFYCHCTSLPPITGSSGSDYGVPLPPRTVLHLCFLPCLGQWPEIEHRLKGGLLSIIVKFFPKDLCRGLTLNQLMFSLTLCVYTHLISAFIACFWPCGQCQPTSQKSARTSVLFNPNLLSAQPWPC